MCADLNLPLPVFLLADICIYPWLAYNELCIIFLNLEVIVCIYIVIQCSMDIPLLECLRYLKNSFKFF